MSAPRASPIVISSLPANAGAFAEEVVFQWQIVSSLWPLSSAGPQSEPDILRNTAQ